MRHSDVIVTGPAGWVDAALPIAACRAGARGFLDLEYTSASNARLALPKLERYAQSGYGLRVGPESCSLVGEWLRTRPSQFSAILLAGGDHPCWVSVLEQLRQHRIEILFEAVNLQEAQRAVELGVDALVLKGQEAGGRVGDEPSFILLQRWLTIRQQSLPIYVHGGAGMHTTAACLLAGARGVLLDAQMLLMRESPLPLPLRQRVAAFDGSETMLVGERLGAAYRVYTRPGLTAVAELLAEEERIASANLDAAEKLEAWRETVHRLCLLGPERGPWLLGQDVAFAANFASRGGTVAACLEVLVAEVQRHLQLARCQATLTEAAPLAKQHGTKYPILQGPMTRVSDVAPFAEAVARGGALPFLALALLRQNETEALLQETQQRLGKLPWGVGLLGFMPKEIRDEQLAAIRRFKPPFALIAGGRPDQAKDLEAEGIPTYLHVPSPGLLRMFLRDGARRFIFEGRECGGHVGPRTSFVLWESMIDVLLEHLHKSKESGTLSVVFAGGIHDARSAAMVATLAAPLAERGVAVGLLMGTAYLFTREAVESGAIVPRFQQEALACVNTALLQTAPGHAIRCVPTPYRDDFERERQRLLASGRSHEEVAKSLEMMNIGRLRLASKGLERDATNKIVRRSESDQYARGMYMIGQVASMRDRVLSIAELHDDVAGGGAALLRQVEPATIRVLEEPTRPPCDIAIVGLASFYPGSKSPSEFWHNILNKVNTVTEVPASHWDWRLYYDPDPRARDKIISRWGGFLKDMPFNPLDYGITPNSLASIEPLQLFLLEASRRALTDAGYDWKDEGDLRTYEPGVVKRSFPRERTAAILGIGGGGSPLAVMYGFRTCLPLLNTVPGLQVDGDEVLEKARGVLPEWTEDSFPGILFNVAVGRVANRFNLGGPNYAIDAACGSSLAAVYACVRELELGTSDLAIAMGADTVQTPYAYMAFSKTHALSPNGRCRPFDAAADGIVLSEGVGAVILKRLDDAIRDGDRIYAIIKGMGASSDGRDKGLTAPRAEGQLRALRRAYRQAGISPAEVELIEAHGTGTVAGDQTESRALAQVMQEAGAKPQSCALGSVKSMIGHTKCAAGIAGLIKAALALHHRTLPPTLVETPNPKGNFEDGPLYLNTEARPWLHGQGPRYAGVSAFGFGGTNFHAVLSEYQGDYLAERPALTDWPAELFVWTGKQREQIAKQLAHVRAMLQAGAQPRLPDLAASTWKAAFLSPDRATLAVLASSLGELQERLAFALEQFQAGKDVFSDPRGIYFTEKPSKLSGELVFLFPGQGSQYPNMLAQLALAFPSVRQSLDRAEAILSGLLDKPLHQYLYPGSVFSAEREKLQRDELTRADVAQPAIGACSLAMFRLLEEFGLSPRFVTGHSYGEFVALAAAGALEEEELLRLSHRRGQVIRSHEMPGGMVAIDVDADKTRPLLDNLGNVQIANSNSPTQTVVAGDEAGLAKLMERCKQQGIRAQRLPVACAFHSPLVAAAREPLAEAIRAVNWKKPLRTVISNVTAAPYGWDIPKTLIQHLTSPVRFREQVETMYAAGARLFVEVGPRDVLTGLVRQTLAGCPHLAVASDVKARPGVVQLLHLLAQLVTHGVAIRSEPLFQAREVQAFELSTLSPTTGVEVLPPTTWMVNSVRNRPLNAPEPVLLGQSRPELKIKSTSKDIKAAPTIGVSRMQSVPPTPTINGDSHHSNGNGHGKPLSLPATEDATAQVMLRFQDLMAKFLETQKSVMTTFLQGGTSTPILERSSPLPSLEPAAIPAAAPVKPQPTAAKPIEDPPAVVAKSEPALAKPVTDRAWITEQLQDLISKRTGYPRDMLGLDIDLEADLGIDSIKRVEILAEMAQALGASEESGMPAGLEMEKLTAIGTLRGIIDYLDSALNQASASPKKSAGKPTKHGPTVPSDQVAIQRAVVAIVDCPILTSPASLLGPGAVVFTDDGKGLANELAGRFTDLGRSTAILSIEELAEETTVQRALDQVREEFGTIGGLVHLLPLANANGLSWDQQARRDTRSLYLLARALEGDLRTAGKQGHTFFVAATTLGGTFGFGERKLPASFTPGQGGVLGFLKCLGQEWPEVTVRAVDFDPSEHQTSDLADRLLAEMATAEGPFEIGYRQGKRVTWAPRAVVLEKTGEPRLHLPPGAPVLITGGARGITAEIAVEFAKRYKPTLLLVGRSPLPSVKEDEATASLTTPTTIKAALIARHEREGRTPAPAKIEAAYQRLLQDREIRNNLERLRAAGATVHYAAVDVRDETSFAKLLDDWQKKFGPFVGVIHGAGVIEDRLVKSKTPESFDRVFDTKVISSRVLADKLQRDRLRFCVFFASLASRYGNKGQADYAAANEVLSKLAAQLDRDWEARVLSVAWGPWSQIGMVADLEKHLVQRGLRLISPQEGPLLLLDELMFGPKGVFEVVFAGGAEAIVQPGHREAMTAR